MRRQLDVQAWSPNLDGSEGCGLRRQALIEVQLIKTATRLRDRHRWRYTCTITSARILTGDVDPRVTVSSRALGGDRSIALRGYRKHIDTAPLRFLLGKRSWRSLIAQRFMNVQSRQSAGGGSTNRYPDEKVLVRPVKIKIIIAIFFEYSIICRRYTIIFWNYEIYILILHRIFRKIIRECLMLEIFGFLKKKYIEKVILLLKKNVIKYIARMECYIYVYVC